MDNVFQIGFPEEIGEAETLRDYAIRKEIECKEQREVIATMRELLADIAMKAHDPEKVTDLCSNALSGIELKKTA
ncbi:TPA: hypothetical protein ACMDTO_000149 [Vibrio cholerae]|uniref:hypothetical protein n=1 Tax=Vibrio TaxID=662 RepID=UPI0000EF9AAD|nr:MULTISPECIES: hypothetical protein [Vibrio]ATD27051.1 hypothetical protein FORC55_1067 [Vibrio cholerae]EGR2105408.1 hypothetical protein [Vibrio cholerae]EGR2446756.1 hypothetical protein [Vibrio cholerae]EGR4280984.1 hypothetical protein [Vibrio cholerae]EGR4294225.1 hypothetical protein [Vibrio cholerae]